MKITAWGRRLVISCVVLAVGMSAGAACTPTAPGGGASAELTALKSENARLTADLASATAQTKTLEGRIAELEGKQAGGTSGGPTAGGAESGAAASASRQIGYIKKVSAGGDSLTIDYVQLLTGKTAVAAAIADGVIKPGETLDNDYYIRNQNAKLRTFSIGPGTSVTVATGPLKTGGGSTAVVSLSKFASAANGADKASVLGKPYWITLKGTTVTKIEEQYLP